jgi:hypothetical protein
MGQAMGRGAAHGLRARTGGCGDPATSKLHYLVSGIADEWWLVISHFDPSHR